MEAAVLPLPEVAVVLLPLAVEPHKPTPVASKSAKVNRPPPLCPLSKARLGPARVFSVRRPIPVNKPRNWITIRVRPDVPKSSWIASITLVKSKVVTRG